MGWQISNGNTDVTGPTNAAIDFVEQGWDFFEAKANLFTDRTLALVSQLGTVPQVQPVEWNIEFPDIAPLTGFTAPVAPTLPAIEMRDIAIPAAPDAQLPAMPGFSEAPAFDVPAPVAIALPRQPGELAVAAPGPVPELTTLVLPDAPEFVLPALPAFASITIPEMPVIAFEDFVGSDPGAAPVLPSLAHVGFTETPYTPTLLNQLGPAIANALNGNTMLSAVAENALFQRARERVSRVLKGTLQAIDEEFSGRGFKLPPGAWRAARYEARLNAQDETLATSRELMVERHKEAVESAKFAVVQGIALEQVLIGQHSAMMDRGLQSAKLLLDVHVSLHNAEVATYNAKLERLKTEAGVFRDKLQAKIAELEAYRAQVDGQRAIADVNKAAADAYDSQVRAIGQVVEMYGKRVAAVQALAEADRTRIEGYRAGVEAYGEQVKAHGLQWDGYKAAIEAQQAGFRSYEIGVNAFGARVQAYAEVERAKSSRYDTQLKGEQLRLEHHGARLKGVLAQLQAEETRLTALGTQSDAAARMYQAAATVEGARSDANTRAFQATVEYYNARASMQSREAEIKMQDAQRLLMAQIEAIRGAAQAMSQLAASAMSAVNFSAGVSGSGSESSSYSYSLGKNQSWSWSGELPDGTAPAF